MTPPVSDASMEKVVEAVTSIRGEPSSSKSSEIWSLGKTLLLLSAALFFAWRIVGGQVEAYNSLVTKVMDQNAADQKANREALAALAQQLARMEQSSRDLSETIRAAFYVSRGADAPRQGRSRP